jgi:hypothetical protein
MRLGDDLTFPSVPHHCSPHSRAQKKIFITLLSTSDRWCNLAVARIKHGPFNETPARGFGLPGARSDAPSTITPHAAAGGGSFSEIAPRSGRYRCLLHHALSLLQ